MKKVLTLLFGALFVLATVSTGFAFSFTFADTVTSPGSWTWTHTLENEDFTPNLSGGEEIEITSAQLEIQLDLTVGTYGIEVITATGDNVFLENLVLTGNQTNYVWTIVMGQDAWNAIENKELDLQLYVTLGSTVNVDSSTLSGNGYVVPLPTSLLLLGSGFIGLIGFRRRRA